MTTEPRVDADLGDAEVAACREARGRGDLAMTLRALEANRGRWDRCWLFVRDIDPDIPRPTFDQLVASHPSSSAAYLLRGAHALAWGWQARGTGWGKSVTEEGWRLLRERTTDAIRNFEQAAALDPSDPTPWALMVRAGLGANWSKERARQAFEEGCRRDPEHWPLYRYMLSWTLPRWHGSAEEAVAFARHAQAGAPPGSLRYGLMVYAHVDRFDTLLRKSEAEADAFGRRSDIRNEVAYARAMSVGHSQHRASAWSHHVHHELAEWAFLCMDRPALHEALGALGGRYDPLHFGSKEWGVERIERIRAWANAPSARQKRQQASQKSQKTVVLTGVVLMGLLFGWVAVATAYQYASPYFAHRFWIVNPTDTPVRVTVDDGRPRQHEPHQALEYDLDSGEHTIRVVRVDDPSVVIDERTLERPGRRLGVLGRSALYDITQAGRYVSARVPYDGTDNELEELAREDGVVVFPARYSSFRSRFPERQPRRTVLYGVCLVRPDGSLPCLR